MQSVWRFWILLPCFLVFSVRAEIRLPKALGENMVLQCDRPVLVWGQADPNEGAVTVRFLSQVHRVEPDAQGNWQVRLDPLKPSVESSKLTIQGRQTSLELTNVLVGEVWLCSGQSNMEFSMAHMTKTKRPADPCLEIYKKELASGTNDQIRLFRVEKKISGSEVVSGGWKTCGGDALYAFSLVGYYFGKNLHQELKVPIGLIQSAWGGTRIEPWIPQETAEGLEVFAAERAASPMMIDGSPVGKNYNGLIKPLVPFALRGVLWYQGESNVIAGNDPLRYVDKMRALVSGWRDAWHHPALPFYSVQLAPYRYTARPKDPVPHTLEDLPAFWEAQALTLAIPHTGLVTITDLVENPSDIHPSNKWDVGKRLADLALTKTYGRTDRLYSGPVYRSMEIEGSKVLLSFDHIGGGLTSRDGKELTHFEIAGPDGIFQPARAVIEDNKIAISSPQVRQPQSVRFGWHETAMPNLCSAEGLAARPFRTHVP